MPHHEGPNLVIVVQVEQALCGRDGRVEGAHVIFDLSVECSDIGIHLNGPVALLVL